MFADEYISPEASSVYDGDDAPEPTPNLLLVLSQYKFPASSTAAPVNG